MEKTQELLLNVILYNLEANHVEVVLESVSFFQFYHQARSITPELENIIIKNIDHLGQYSLKN